MQINVKQPVIQPRIPNFYIVGKHKRFLKLPRCNTAMDKSAPLRVVILSASDHKLVIFLCDLEIRHGEPGNGQSHAQRFLVKLLNIIRWVTI